MERFWKSSSILILSLLLAVNLAAQEQVVEKMELPAIDSGDVILEYLGFTVKYNTEKLVPDWVAYAITAEEAYGDVPRASGFSMDLNYPGRQARREDYSNSGWDKGHMAPAADMKWSQQAMWESFYLTNICPQNHDLNSKDWHILENYVREWAVRYGNLFVVCGPIFRDGKFGTIGENKVAVPDAFFKALLRCENGEYKCIAFVFENESQRQPVTRAVLTVNQVEDICGFDLFYNLPDNIEENIEGDASWEDWK